MEMIDIGLFIVGGNYMKMVKCPNCQGKGEYEVIQIWDEEDIISPVKCNCEGGKISWEEFCNVYRNNKCCIKKIK